MLHTPGPTDWIVTVLAHTWDGRVVRKRVGVTPNCTEQQARQRAIDSFRRSIVTPDNEYGLPVGFHLPPGGVKVLECYRRNEAVRVFQPGSRYQELIGRNR